MNEDTRQEDRTIEKKKKQTKKKTQNKIPNIKDQGKLLSRIFHLTFY